MNVFRILNTMDFKYLFHRPRSTIFRMYLYEITMYQQIKKNLIPKTLKLRKIRTHKLHVLFELLYT